MASKYELPFHNQELQGIAEGQVRLGFIKKVYGIVCSQLLFTVLVAALCCGPFRPSIVSLVRDHGTAWRWGSLIALLFSMLLCAGGKGSYPLNFLGLCCVTSVVALQVGVLSGVFAASGLGALVMQSALITGLLILGLTIYTFRSKRDFSFLGALLFPMVFGLFVFGLLSMWFTSLQTGLVHLMMSFLGAAIFCGYLVFDTWRLAKILDVDDYVEGAIQLYLDIINLFFYILDILKSMNER